MKYLCYDVETANATKRGSICAIGWVLIEDETIKDKGYSLINPQCPFSIRCVEVHGITRNQVKGAPTFAQYWESCLRDMMCNTLVVAHNAIFDISATEQALANAGLSDPGIYYMDTLPVARQLLQAERYRLIDLATVIGWHYNPHNAMEDAEALAHVLIGLRDMKEYDSIAQMFLFSGCAVQNTLRNNFEPTAPCVKQYEEVAIIDDRLAGARICITGDVPGVPREEIERLIIAHGGKPTSGVSGKTDYLMVGIYENRDPNYISGKKRKAMELIETGGKIKIIAPHELVAMMGCDDK